MEQSRPCYIVERKCVHVDKILTSMHTILPRGARTGGGAGREGAVPPWDLRYATKQCVQHLICSCFTEDSAHPDMANINNIMKGKTKPTVR